MIYPTPETNGFSHLKMDGWKDPILSPFLLGWKAYFQVLLLMVQNSQTTTWDGAETLLIMGV